MIFKNAANTPLNANSGTLPEMSGAVANYFQKMVFTLVGKVVATNFEVVETPTPLNFQGVIQPFTDRQLYLKPEGERAWSWYMVHAETALQLNVDDVIVFHNVQYRTMSKKNYGLYGFVEYHLVQDWTGAGP